MKAGWKQKLVGSGGAGRRGPIRRVENPGVPGSRLARVCATLGGALVDGR